MSSPFVEERHIEDGLRGGRSERQLAMDPLRTERPDRGRTIESVYDPPPLKVVLCARVRASLSVAKLDHKTAAAGRAGDDLHGARLARRNSNPGLLDAMHGGIPAFLKVNSSWFRVKRDDSHIVAAPPVDRD